MGIRPRQSAPTRMSEQPEIMMASFAHPTLGVGRDTPSIHTGAATTTMTTSPRIPCAVRAEEVVRSNMYRVDSVTCRWCDRARLLERHPPFTTEVPSCVPVPVVPKCLLKKLNCYRHARDHLSTSDVPPY